MAVMLLMQEMVGAVERVALGAWVAMAVLAGEPPVAVVVVPDLLLQREATAPQAFQAPVALEVLLVHNLVPALTQMVLLALAGVVAIFLETAEMADLDNIF